jgi:hypothetical protein
MHLKQALSALGLALATTALIGVAPAWAGTYIGPDRDIHRYDIVPVPGYPLANPLVSDPRPLARDTPIVNVYTGVLEYTVTSIQTFQSNYQPYRAPAGPGAVRSVDEWVPDVFGGSVHRRGTTWTDRYGNEHGDLNYTYPTSYGHFQALVNY